MKPLTALFLVKEREPRLKVTRLEAPPLVVTPAGVQGVHHLSLRPCQNLERHQERLLPVRLRVAGHLKVRNHFLHRKTFPVAVTMTL
jgi:hypothetical protein